MTACCSEITQINKILRTNVFNIQRIRDRLDNLKNTYVDTYSDHFLLLYKKTVKRKVTY